MNIDAIVPEKRPTRKRHEKGRSALLVARNGKEQTYEETREQVLRAFRQDVEDLLACDDAQPHHGTIFLHT